jgi:uncharacterized protein YecA (UPF0149 family)
MLRLEATSLQRASRVLEPGIPRIDTVRTAEQRDYLARLEGLATVLAVGPEVLSSALVSAMGSEEDPEAAAETMTVALQISLKIGSRIAQYGRSYEPDFLDYADDAELPGLCTAFADGFSSALHLRQDAWKDFAASPHSGRMQWLLTFKGAEPSLADLKAELRYLGEDLSWLQQYWTVHGRFKQGRNASCACGSGKKAKHCCGTQ